MVELLYINTIGYEAGQPKAFFTLVDMELMRKSEVAVFGVGAVACYTYNYLKEIGIDVKCFVNNDKRMWGKKLNGGCCFW